MAGLQEQAVTAVAMESTGIFWRPVWNILEGQEFELLLANARGRSCAISEHPGLDQRPAGYAAGVIAV